MPTIHGKVPLMVALVWSLWGIDGLSEVQFDPNVNNLLIIDDLMEELANGKKGSTLFTRDMHHKDLSFLCCSKPVQAR